MKPKRIFSAHQTQFRLATTLCAAMHFSALPGHAQFTDDYQTNIINGTTVNWPGPYYFGSNHVADAPFILNGGSLTNGRIYLVNGGATNFHGPFIDTAPSSMTALRLPLRETGAGVCSCAALECRLAPG